LNNFELSATIMTNSIPDHNTSASKTVWLVYTHWSVKRSPLLRYTRQRPSLKRSKNRDSSLKRMCCQVSHRLQRQRARAQASIVVLWRCLRIDSRSFLRTVWPEIRTFARPGVLQAVSSAVIIRFQMWIRHTCLSWRCDVTRGLPLWGLSFVLPVCRRRITSLERVILDTSKWSATAWWVIPAWTIPTAR
jgi:hypothetical protein